MNRNEMIEGIMRQAGISKANVARFYAGLVALAQKELVRSKEFVLPGLGALRVRKRRARTGRNPQTGETIRIPAKKVVRFRAYRTLDEILNGPREATEAVPEDTATPEPPAPPTPETDDAGKLWPESESPEEQ